MFVFDTVDEAKNRSNYIKVHGNFTKECIRGLGNVLKFDTYDESESRFSVTTLERWRKVQITFVTYTCVMSTFRRIEAIDVYNKNFKQRGNRALQHEIQGRRNSLQVLHGAENQNIGR